jgi:hypothetical protein
MPSRRLVAALLALLIAATGTSLAVADGGPGAADASGRKDHDHRGGKGHDRDRQPPAPPAPAPAPTSATPAPAPVAPPPAPVAPAPAPAPAAATPELGRSVALAPVAGTVLVRVPGGDPAPLVDGAALPTGTRVDARQGAVALTSALDAAGATQTGRFTGGVFVVRQAASAKGLTQIVLVGGALQRCRATTARTATAHTAKKRKPIRRLWGRDDGGRFQTRGRGSVATVRGTRWLTEDFCDGTRTTVTSGAVAVRSRRTGRTTLVHAGHHRFVAR